MPAALNSTHLLLSALRPDQTPASWESDRIRSDADWDDLAVRAIVLGLAPQVHDRLRRWALRPPPRPAAKLAATYDAAARRYAAIHGQLGQALAAFEARGLHPIILKGVHLAAFVYPDPALRPMNDIDLLFRPDELRQAERVLTELGYDGKHKPSALGAGVTKHVSTFRRESGGRSFEPAATPNPYLSPESDPVVEPHISLEESWFGLKVDITPGVRERAVHVVRGGRSCRALANEDLLLHLCVHFCFHLIMGAPSMVQLADMLAVTRRVPLDWAVFASRACEQRAAPFALAALTLARKLLGAPVAMPVFETLSQATPSALRRHIEMLDLAGVLRRTQQKPLTSISQRIVRGIADRAETARWAADWRGRWRVWSTALNILATDTGRMLAGRPLKSSITNNL